MTTKDDSYYILTYRDSKDNEITTIEARTINDSNLGLSFIRISDFMLEEQSTSVINPKLEKLKARFEKTKNLHLSIYSIISIEEVGFEHRGLAFQNNKANLVVFKSE